MPYMCCCAVVSWSENLPATAELSMPHCSVLLFPAVCVVCRPVCLVSFWPDKQAETSQLMPASNARRFLSGSLGQQTSLQL